ncbi:hypothetical protein MRX96_053116 [Rhipicephalus microplus]
MELVADRLALGVNGDAGVASSVQTLDGLEHERLAARDYFGGWVRVDLLAFFEAPRDFTHTWIGVDAAFQVHVLPLKDLF